MALRAPPLVQALICCDNADVAQLVEHHLAKVRVAGSNPVVRSKEDAGRRPVTGNGRHPQAPYGKPVGR